MKHSISQTIPSLLTNTETNQIEDSSLNIQNENSLEEEPSTTSVSNSLNNISDKTVPPTLFSELCQQDVIFKFLKCICLQIGMHSIYSVTLYLNNDLGIQNVYLNGSLLALFGIIGYLLNFVFSRYMGHRAMNIMINVIVLTICLLLLIIDLVSNSYIPYEQRSSAVRILETSSLYSILNYM